VSEEFDTRAALGRLNEILARYENETLEWYEEKMFIKDILFFLGKAIDEKKCREAKTFRYFLNDKIHPIADDARTSVKKEFARELGMRP